MVEWLSYAAEITAGLLLISLGFDRAGSQAPKRRQVDNESSSNSCAEPLRKSLEASRAELWWLQSQCAVLSSVDPVSELESDSMQSTHTLLRDLAQQIDRVVPVEQRDSLTALQNKLGFEHFVSRFLVEQEAEEVDPNANNQDVSISEKGTAKPLSATARKGTPVAMFDIDDLKAFNDNHGMENGDGLLCQVANWLRSELAPIGFSARIQGGQFIAACPFLDAKTAFLLIEKTRDKLASTPFMAKGQEQFITLSSSLLILDPHGVLEDSLQKLADGLFHSKSKGKNCGHWWNGENWIGVELETPVSAPEVIETKVETVVQTPVEEPAPMEPTPIEPAPSNSKDRASQNDIEALLAGAQAIKRDVAPKVAEVKDPSAKASQNDIEALLAGAQAIKRDVASKVAEVKDPSSKATNDDIADLFASVKALQAETNVAAKPVESVEPLNKETKSNQVASDPAPEPRPTADYPEASDSNQPASPDDIAALFAAMRPKG